MLISILVSLAMVLAYCGNPADQKAQTPPSNTPTELSLNRTNDGHRVTAKVGQPIVITLQTIGPGRYSTPRLSSHAVRFEGFHVRASKGTEPRWPEAGVSFYGNCRGRSASPNPAHGFQTHNHVYNSGHKAVTNWILSFRLPRYSGAGSNGRCNTIWYKEAFKGGVYETRETVWAFRGAEVRCVATLEGGADAA